MMGVMAMLSIPLALLNMLGGVVAFAWLLLAGQWRLLVTALFVLLAGGFVIPILLVLTTLLAAAGAAAFQRGSRVTMFVMATVGNLWTVIVTMVWQVFVFFYFGRFGQGSLALPVWLLSYAVATGVFSWMANKTPRNQGPGLEVLHAFAAQLAYVAFSACVLIFRLDQRSSLAVMAVVLLAPVVGGLYLARRVKFQQAAPTVGSRA